MSVNIKGIKRLNQNDYEKIIIIEQKNGYLVNLIYSKKEETTTNTKINNPLKGKSDIEQIKIIINNYLDNTKINKLSEYQLIPYYTSSFNIINGDKDLYFSLHNEEFNDIKNKVKNKYYSDRLKTVEENKNITYYNFKLDSASSYNIVCDSYFGEKIEFSLLGHKKHLQNDLYIDEEERAFFQEFIYNKLLETGEEAVINNNNLYDEETEGYINLGYDVTCGSIVINIDNSDLFPEIVGVVDKYNKERKNIKIKKLK